jgi:hypothetical protein
MNIHKKQIDKIYKKISDIAKMGKDGILDYMVLIDELVSNGQYQLLSDTLIHKYNIDIDKYQSIDEVKKKTYDSIRFLTLPDFQIDLKKIYDDNNVYQVSFNIYDNTTNVLLGQIKETETILSEYQAYKDQKLIEIQDQPRVVHLEVTKGNTNIVLNDVTISLIDKYKLAISLLK